MAGVVFAAVAWAAQPLAALKSGAKAPTVVAKAPTVVAKAPTVVAKAPTVVAKAPTVVAKAPTVVAATQSTSACPMGFSEVAAELGVRFVHRTGARGEHHLPETMGSGVAWYDYDGDGWLDLYLVQSGPFPPGAAAPEEGQGNVLLRNLGSGSDGGWRGFEDWTARSAAGDSGYGQGVLPVDLDGDGRLDLLLGNYGGDVVLRATASGTYTSSALPELGPSPTVPRWTSSIAAADADGDGDLDLYLARYLRYDSNHGLLCGGAVRQACDPALFEGATDAFLANQGGELIPRPLAELGLEPAGPPGKGLGVLWSDLDGDRLPDLYVANDLTLNSLFRATGGGAGASQFEDMSLLSGTAVNALGRPEAGMGVALGDLDGDGDPELMVTNFDVETNTLYENRGGMEFEDVSATSGFGLPSFNRLGFGLVVADFDLDGALDAFVANGHIFERPQRGNVGFEQPDMLLRGDGRGNFAEVTCVDLGAERVSRGAAGGDFDNDGDIDLAINNSAAAAKLLRNGSTAAPARHWVGVELVGTEAGGRNTQAIGARVSLRGASRTSTGWVLAGDSYQSSSDRRLVFALPPETPAVETLGVLEIEWPRPGGRQRIELPPTARGHYLRVVQP
jgi:hypothetical protein